MRMKLASVLGFAIVLACAATAQAVPIVQYNFNDNDADPDVLAANVTASNFTAGPSLLDTTFTGGNAAARGWNPSDTAQEALDNGDYWFFTVTANAGFQFDLTSISLDEFRETNGPLFFQIWSNNSLVGSSMSTSTSSTNHIVALSGTDLTNLEIRIVGWDAQNNGNTSDWILDNVFLNGTVEATSTLPPQLATPEPASLVLLGSGLLGSAWRMRRRRSTSV